MIMCIFIMRIVMLFDYALYIYNLWSFVLFEIFQVPSLFYLLACSLLDRLTALISHRDQYAQNHY
jgi:hypothetical protein